MKKNIIMIGILGLFLELGAKEYAQVAPTRVQMVLEAKQLMQRYDMLKNKKVAWQKRQVAIINDFNKIHDTDEHFGDGNKYGKKRLEKRQNDFYTSLQEKNDEIEKTLLDVKRKLAKVKKQFSHLYAAPLTIEEIRGGEVPQVADKENKIRLLKKYINSKKSWKACLAKNKSFDLKRVDIDNRADMSEKKYNNATFILEKKVNKNLVAQKKYEQMTQAAQLEYSQKYGYIIKSDKTAKRILKNIKD